MTDLIKVRNLKGKQSKKKWKKNIDVTALMQNIENNNTNIVRQELNKKYPQQLIVEDTRDKRKKPLQRNRFKRKFRDPKLFSNTQKLKLRRINVDDIKKNINNNLVKNQEQIFDVWNLEKKQNIHSKKETVDEVKIPAVMIPIGGQSYNPNENDYKQLVDKIIQIEGPQKLDIRPKKIKKIQKLVVRSRNKNVRQQQLDMIKRKQQKKLNFQLANLKLVKKQIENQQKKIEETKQRAKNLKQKLRNERMTGRIRTGPRLSKQRYRFKQDIVPDIEAVPISKQEFRQEVIRERFDSIYRRGIFEPKKYTMHENRRKHIKVKVGKDSEQKLF